MTTATLHLLAQAATTAPADDDFAPGLLIGAVLVVLVAVCLLVVGTVLAVVAAAVVAGLAGVGVVSASALVAVAARRPSAGARMLLYQVAALAGAPCGVPPAWLLARGLHLHMGWTHVVELGLVAGVAGGLALAFALDKVTVAVLARWRQRHAAA